MSEQKLFTIYGDACFHADNEQHAYEKLGKYFLSISKKKPVEFQEIFTKGSITVQPRIEKE